MDGLCQKHFFMVDLNILKIYQCLHVIILKTHKNSDFGIKAVILVMHLIIDYTAITQRLTIFTWKSNWLSQQDSVHLWSQKAIYVTLEFKQSEWLKSHISLNINYETDSKKKKKRIWER